MVYPLVSQVASSLHHYVRHLYEATKLMEQHLVSVLLEIFLVLVAHNLNLAPNKAGFHVPFARVLLSSTSIQRVQAAKHLLLFWGV